MGISYLISYAECGPVRFSAYYRHFQGRGPGLWDFWCNLGTLTWIIGNEHFWSSHSVVSTLRSGRLDTIQLPNFSRPSLLLSVASLLRGEHPIESVPLSQPQGIFWTFQRGTHCPGSVRLQFDHIQKTKLHWDLLLSR
jgi:hypothetical protein